MRVDNDDAPMWTRGPTRTFPLAHVSGKSGLISLGRTFMKATEFGWRLQHQSAYRFADRMSSAGCVRGRCRTRKGVRMDSEGGTTASRGQGQLSGTFQGCAAFLLQRTIAPRRPTMYRLSILLFAVAAVAGLTMAVMHFKNATPPRPVLAVLHGLFAASGLVVLLLAVHQGRHAEARRRSHSACWWWRRSAALDC